MEKTTVFFAQTLANSSPRFGLVSNLPQLTEALRGKGQVIMRAAFVGKALITAQTF